jgi:hypothetical protein
MPLVGDSISPTGTPPHPSSAMGSISPMGLLVIPLVVDSTSPTTFLLIPLVVDSIAPNVTPPYPSSG